MARALGIGIAVLAAAGLAVFLVVRGASVFSSGNALPGGGESKTAKGDEPLTATAAVAKPPAFTAWPAPAAALVLSGEAHGYLEPCGCTENQSGGVARRSDLFKQLRDRGWPVAGLDLGGTVKRTRKQTEYKFVATTDALRKMGYRGLGLGPEELRLQPAFLIGQNAGSEPTGEGLAFLGANETFFGLPESELPGGPKRLTVFELGGMKVGAAMVVGESRQQGIFPEGAGSDVAFVPPADVLGGVVKNLEAAGTRLNVLLSYADLDESRRLAERFPQFAVVVSAGGPEDPHGEPERVGKTLLVTVGHKGKHAGVLGVYPDDPKQPLRFDLVDLSKDRFRHDTAMDAIMKEYQQTLRDNLSDVFNDLPEGFPPGEGTYVGAAKCGECHKQAFAKWKETKHAGAYESLAEGRPTFEGTWVPRSHDPECLSCHVTGWNPQEAYPYVSGFLPQEIAAERNAPQRFAALKGQQCENCHGPGSGHVAVFEKWTANPRSVTPAEQAAAKAAVKVDLATAKQSQCIRCHDLDNDPHFDFDTYWPKVQHTGLRN